MNGLNVGKDGSLTLPSGASTDAFGSFYDVVFNIPSTASAGSQTITVSDASSHSATSPSFTVVSASRYTDSSVGLVATQASTTMSGLVVMSYSGPSNSFCAKASVPIYIDGIKTNETVDTGANLKFGGDGAQPDFGLIADLPVGIHQVTLYDATDKCFADTTLTLSSPLTLSPSTGAPSTSVTVTGAGTTSVQTMSGSGVGFSTFFDSAAVTTGGTSTANGATSSTFTVPGGWGTHFVYLEQTSGTDNGHYVPAVAFTVPQPTMTATATGGFDSGNLVTLAGSGFAGSTGLGAIYAGSLLSLTSGTTTSSGAFSGVTFTLPAETADTYPLIVTDTKGDSFTIAIDQTG